MKKRGFVLMETIVVIVVVTVSLVTIFSSYNKILTKVKSENKYDTSEYIYVTRQIKKYMKEKNTVSSTLADLSSDYFSGKYDYTDQLTDDEKKILGVKKIYILALSNGNVERDEHFKNFDAYMIDYIRRLDYKGNLIIVEYQRPVRDENYKEQYFYGKTSGDENKLYETYIASLRW